MSKEELFSSYRWNDPPVISKAQHREDTRTKEEKIKDKEDFLKILVEKKQLTQEEADEKLKKFIESEGN